MSDTKQYADASGQVQQFGKDAAVVTMAEANGQQVARFTIKTGNGTLMGLTLWPEFHKYLPYIKRGSFVAVHGAYSSNVNNGKQYHNISVQTIAITPALDPEPREQVNVPAQQVVAAPVADAGPVQASTVAAPVAVAAPAGTNLTF